MLFVSKLNLEAYIICITKLVLKIIRISIFYDLRFSIALKGYKMGTLARNGLNQSQNVVFLPLALFLL